MDTLRFAGALLRLLRLKANWSQQTLCDGICAVSYLSKIEQGKVSANADLVEALFKRLGYIWEDMEEDRYFCEELYDNVFSLDYELLEKQIAILDTRDEKTITPFYLDFLIIRSFVQNDISFIPKEMMPVLEGRQRALYSIICCDPETAYAGYSCAMTAFCVAVKAYQMGNYTYSLEYLQTAYDLAACEGRANIMMLCQVYMANCNADIGNMEAMQRHSMIGKRLAVALGNQEMVENICYNLAATEVEIGDYDAGYRYFSTIKDHSVRTLHKLAICCEALGLYDGAYAAIERAGKMEDVDPLDNSMLELIRYRLDHPKYLHDNNYGIFLQETFDRIRQERHFGYARFHLRWVIEWLKANRRYKIALDLLQDFTKVSY